MTSNNVAIACYNMINKMCLRNTDAPGANVAAKR